jgi:hypothetical protein
MATPLAVLASRAGSVLLLAALLPGSGSAQRVQGRVVDSEARGLPDVTVETRAAGGRQVAPVVTDSAGRFLLLLPAAGTYELQATVPGYIGLQATSVTVDRDEEVEVVIRADVAALRLAALEVTARRRLPLGREIVNRRIEYIRQTGIGRAITRDELELSNPRSVGAALSRVSGRVRVLDSDAPWVNTIILSGGGTGGRGTCTPAIFIDGNRVNHRPTNVHSLIQPERIDAIELYVGSGQTPQGFQDPLGCGSILIWSRAGTAKEGKPHGLLRWAIAAVVAVGVLLVIN